MTDLVEDLLRKTYGVEKEDESETTAQTEAAHFDFDDDFQARIAALSLRDARFMRRTDGVLNPEYFDNQARGLLVSIAQEYYNRYRVLPGGVAVLVQFMKEEFNRRRIGEDIRKAAADELRALVKKPLTDGDYIAEQVGKFARHQAVMQAHLDSIALMEKGDIDRAQQVMEKAYRVGVADDFEDLDYWNTIEARTEYRKDKAAGLIKPNGITTGFKKLDQLLYHRGWGRQELSVIMGGAKKGKSTGLIHFGAKASMAGYNVLYVTLEVASRIIAERADAALSEVPMSDLETRIYEVENGVKNKDSTGRGEFRINQFPSGTLTPRALRRLIEKYKAEGMSFDLIIVDYADIMAPDHYMDSDIANSKQIWLGLRAVAYDENAAVLTATQTNRDGFKHDTAKAEDVAEDFNKIRIADLVMSINRNDEERDRGEARLYFAASRNQAGEFTVHIKQDLSTMRFITAVGDVT